MPRSNSPRSVVGGERNLAVRIERERNRRGLTYDALAKLMTQAGCPIQGSALFKIEKSEPPRRITVDELVALAQVFQTTVEDLLTPLEILEQEWARAVAAELQDAEAELRRATVVLLSLLTELLMTGVEDQDVAEYVLGHAYQSVPFLPGEDDPMVLQTLAALEDNDDGRQALIKAIADHRSRLIDQAENLAARSLGGQP